MMMMHLIIWLLTYLNIFKNPSIQLGGKKGGGVSKLKSKEIFINLSKCSYCHTFWKKI